MLCVKQEEIKFSFIPQIYSQNTQRNVQKQKKVPSSKHPQMYVPPCNILLLQSYNYKPHYTHVLAFIKCAS